MFSLEESPRAFVFNRSQSSCIFRLVGYPLGLPFFHFITAGSTFSFEEETRFIVYNLDIFFNSYSCFFFFFPLNRDMGCGAVFESKTLQLDLLNRFDFILSSIFPVAEI